MKRTYLSKVPPWRDILERAFALAGARFFLYNQT